MRITEILLLIGFVLNILLVLSMVFIERKKTQSIISWLFILTVFPIVGFLVYVLIGGGLSFKTRSMIRKKHIVSSEYNDYIQLQKRKIRDRALVMKNVEDVNMAELMLFNINNSNSALFLNNSVVVFVDGKSKIENLIKDIRNAKQSINLAYYIFASDKVGKRVMKELCEKAREGVKVKLLYDSVGSIRSKRRFFAQLVKAGGEVAEFFPPVLGMRMLNFRINFRNHRKIVVIDGRVGYVGGINIRDDHMNESKKLCPWRDTHVRIDGGAVYDLQIAFFSDWVYAKNKKLNYHKLEKEGYFQKIENDGKVMCQVVTSGPDNNEHTIEQAMIKMISLAKRRICLQSPYFVPDDNFFGAIRQAVLCDVQVDIMIPSIADKRIVHQASLSFAKDAVNAGANVYLYDGFLHSKTLLVDDLCVSIGSCNADNRSFSLNFEINAFFFGKDFVKFNEQIFDEDMARSKKIDGKFFKKKKLLAKMGQAFYRLFAPLL